MLLTQLRPGHREVRSHLGEDGLPLMLRDEHEKVVSYVNGFPHVASAPVAYAGGEEIPPIADRLGGGAQDDHPGGVRLGRLAADAGRDTGVLTRRLSPAAAPAPASGPVPAPLPGRPKVVKAVRVGSR